MARLTDAQVEEVRRLRAEGVTYRAISNALGCSLSTAWSICSGRNRSCKAVRTIRIATMKNAPEISALQVRGLGRDAIAIRLGLTSSSVHRVLWSLKHALGSSQ